MVTEAEEHIAQKPEIFLKLGNKEKNMKISIFVLVLVVMSSFVYSAIMPLNTDISSGCLEYVELGGNHIIGEPDISEGSTKIYSYRFEFYVPEVDAHFEDLRLEVRRDGGFETYEYCAGPVAAIAKVNDLRAGISEGDRGQTYVSSGYEFTITYVHIYPEEQLVVGENSVYLENMPEVETKCTTGSCKDMPYEKTGICAFNVCGFYPELKIESDEPPESIYSNETFTLDIQILNGDEVDAGVVTIEIIDTDFDVEPRKTTQLIQNKGDVPFNKFEYKATFTPEGYVELETGLESVPKRAGTIAVTFTDSNDNERQFTKELGAITIMDLSPEEEMDRPKAEEPEAAVEKGCLAAFILLLPLSCYKRS